MTTTTDPGRTAPSVPWPHERATHRQPEAEACPSHQVACVLIVSATVAEDITAEQLNEYCAALLTGDTPRMSDDLFGELADMPKRVTSLSGPRGKLLNLAARSVQQHGANEVRG